jgi:hypothetical protein
MHDAPALRDLPLRELLAEPLSAGSIVYDRGYEAVHEANVRTIRSAAAAPKRTSRDNPSAQGDGHVELCVYDQLAVRVTEALWKPQRPRIRPTETRRICPGGHFADPHLDPAGGRPLSIGLCKQEVTGSIPVGSMAEERLLVADSVRRSADPRPGTAAG